jgi:Lrp/AsnC family transcriptional regulator for asnA, asnC and gidA
MVCQEIKVSATLLADGHHYRPKESPVSLDPLDFALIEALQQDSRLSAASLAAKLGTSKSTVSRTMKHLLDEGVIRFMTVVNPYALGYEGMAFIGMKVSPTRINDVAEALARHKHVYTVALSAGRYDVLAWTIFRERRDLMNLLTMELSNIAGVDSMESAINLKIIKASYRFVDMQQKS